MLILANGHIIPQTEQSVLLDRNFLHAYGVFTTLKIQNNKVLWFNEHWMRLLKHAQAINIQLPISKHRCFNQIQQLLKQAPSNYPNTNTFKLRLIVTAGVLQADLAAPTQNRHWYIFLEPFKPQLTQHSFCVTLSPYPINEHSPLSGIKQCNYLESILAKQYAINHGYHDALRQNSQGFITGGSSFNIFMIKNKKLYTPCLKSGALAGITRAHIIKSAQEKNIQTIETNLTLKELLTAETVFATNSIINIKRITRINAHDFKLNPTLYEYLTYL